MIKYKPKGKKKWATHNIKYSDIPIKYKTKKGALKALTKKYRLVYQTNPIKIVKYKKT